MDKKLARKNFLLGVLNGVFFQGGGAFISASSILPLFLSHLTTSRALIGLASLLDLFGWYFPQYFVATLFARRKRYMPIYSAMAFFRISIFAVLILAIFYGSNSSPSTTLTLFMIIFTLYTLSGGIAGVAFLEVVSKVINPNSRGAFFAARNLLGGLFAISCGAVITWILKNFSYPANFTILFSFTLLLIILGMFMFMMVKEPELEPANHPVSVRERFFRAPVIFLSDPNSRHLLTSRILTSAFYMALPFYVLHFKDNLNLPSSLAGTFVAAEMSGTIFSNLLWGYLADRVSSRLVLTLTGVTAIIAPLLALSSHAIELPFPLLLLVFITLGMTQSGFSVGYWSYLLDIARPEDRPQFMGFMNTLLAPTVLYSLAGGIIVNSFSYPCLWLTTLLLTTLGLFSTLMLRDSKKRRP